MSALDHSRDEQNPMIGYTKSSNTISFMRAHIACSFFVSLFRIGFVTLAFSLKYVILPQDPWCFLLYLLVGLVDIITTIGEVNTYKSLVKQQKTLERLDIQRQQMAPVTQRLEIGREDTYFSVYETLYAYKYRYNPTASSYSITRYLHVISTFLIFGSLSLNSADTHSASVFQLTCLVLVLLSVYCVNFEADYSIMEASNGRYRRVECLGLPIRTKIVNTFHFWRKMTLASYSLAFVCVIATLITMHITCVFEETPSLFLSVHALSVFLLANCLLQVYLIRNSNEQLLLHPKHSEDCVTLCSCYQLLQELQSRCPKICMIVTSGTRICSFLCLLALMYSLNPHLNSRVAWLVGICCVGLIIACETVKFCYGHLHQISYLTIVNEMPLQKCIQKVCSICLNNYVDNRVMVELPCSSQHSFHHSCLLNWTQTKQECPLCRRDLSQFLA